MLPESEIKRLCDHGLLFKTGPFDWRVQKSARTIYTPQNLYQFLTESSASEQTNNERRSLQALFDRFISGESLTVALHRDVEGTHIKRLDPASNEVWEFKVKPPRQEQSRVFGRFAALDTIILLTGPETRSSINYRREILRCQREWERFCNGFARHEGRSLSDYLSGANVILVGNP